jgi:hypothetical protein
MLSLRGMYTVLLLFISSVRDACEQKVASHFSVNVYIHGIDDDKWVLKGSTLWSSGQSSGFDSRRYQIYWQVVSLERGPLSLVSTIEELLERKISSPV